MAQLTPKPKMQFFNSNGDLLSGGKIYTYEAGTSTPLATYTDQTEAQENTNPVILDARGQGSIWLGPAAYKIVVHDASDVLQPDGGDNIIATPGQSTYISTSISDLRTIDGTLLGTVTVKLLGYYALSYKGGGLFYWDSTSTEADNSGTIIKVAGVVTGRWKRLDSDSISVSWFGGDIHAAILAIGTTETTLTIDTNVTMTKDDTVPTTLTLDFMRGSIIDGAWTLTVNGKVSAGVSKLFGALITVAFGSYSIGIVQVGWWGAVGSNSIADGTTNKVAIDSALATGKDTMFGTGTYYSDGLHRIAAEKQQVMGFVNTTLKKATASAHLLDTVFAQNYIGLKDMFLDGNGQINPVLIWRGHYSEVTNVDISNVAAGHYGMRISGSNLSSFTDVSADGLLIDKSGDPSYAPTYSCLYSTFNNVTLVTETSSARSCLKIAGSLALNLTFNSLYLEAFTLSEPIIAISGSNVGNLSFNDLNAEFSLATEPFCELANALVYDVHFKGGKASTAAASTQSMFANDSCPNFSIENMLISDTFSLAGNSIITLAGVEGARFIGNILDMANDFNFVSATSIYNNKLTSKNNTTKGAGIGTNVWGSSTRVVSENDELIQDQDAVDGMTIVSPANHSQNGVGFITVADDGYYDLFGDGGVTAPGSNCSGFLKVATKVSATSHNNIAFMYLQCGGSGGFTQSVPIAVGSNVEIDVLAGVVAALANTTDGKLGIQIGGTGANTIFTRIYNRTGAEVTLYVHFDRCT